MAAEARELLEYIVFCVGEFADRYELARSDAYRYLCQYQGIQFVVEGFDHMHMISFFDVVDFMTTYCRKNGGYLE